ncbi:ParB/RepB/Spo0J family partition protein [Ralstonia pseudosolanacearum]|uniref:ParB/RepB/Spo0J family partition protein n=1 Tax=Ralstonia pseudosolanacearum TaxID=1310165 RepID=UPI003CE7422F
MAEFPTTHIDKPISEILREKGISVDDAPPANQENRTNGHEVAVVGAHTGNELESVTLGVDKGYEGGKRPALPLSSASEIAAPIRTDLIDTSPFQPRLIFVAEAIVALAATIQDAGLNNPIIVRPKANGRYELIAGERRLRAFQLNRETLIPAFVRQLSDEDAAILATTDNEAREDLSDYERGRSYKRLLDGGIVKSQMELARRVGRSMATISRCLAYFKLPAEVLEMLDANPLLIGVKVVADFVSFTEEGYKSLVIEAMGKISFNKLSQENALNWLKGEVRRLKNPGAPIVPRHLKIAGTSVAGVKIDGRKLTLQCPKEVNPEHLLGAIEKALATLEMDALLPTDA